MLYKSGAPYFSGTAVTKYLYWEHHGYQYDPENHTKLGYMSNNTTTYYSGQYRFSNPPRQPSDYYGPPAEEGLGWVQYKAPAWDGALQDATKEPWRSLCLFWHGVARFISDTNGTQNRYRKPVLLFYRRSATCQYIYQAYAGTATVTATVRNQGYIAANSFIVRLTTNPATSIQDRTISLAANAVTTLTYAFIAPSYLDATNITVQVTADAANTVAESNEGNNTASKIIGINALRPDLIIESANTTDWYAGMDVLVSAKVTNLSAQPVPSATIRLTAGTVTVNEIIPVPGNGSNLAVFLFTVPTPPDPPGTMPLVVTITADPDNAVNEVNENNNVWTKTETISLVPVSIVADPDSQALEQEHLARNKAVPSLPQVNPSIYHTWQEVRLVNGSYVVRTFWAQLTTIFSITPDSRIAYPDNPDLMESGFGVQAYCKTTLTTNYDHPEKLIGSQMVWMYTPESGYGQGQWQNVRNSLVTSSGSAGDKTIEWQYAVNPYSTTGSRLHYTPLWFLDGQYTALVQAFYAWSPVGQMVDYESDSIIIQGDMYDRLSVVRR